jgi:hypothetical protein
MAKVPLEAKAACEELLLRRASASCCVFFLEPIDPALRVDELVFAGEKWVAVRADFYVETAACRLGFDAVSAGTNDARWRVDRVNFFFHDVFASFCTMTTRLPYP